MTFAADLPVREVILYKNGVAFFERSGELKSGEAAKLDFKASEMNDLLKSLTVSDGAGGKVTAVRYDSAEPLDRKLADLPIQIGPGQPLSAFLDRMKGSIVTLRIGSETLTGTIVTARVVTGDKEHKESEQMTLLLDSGELRTVDLAGVAALKFTDPAVERQLKTYLGFVSQARSTDRRSVYIDSTGNATRRIAASYMIPAPVWKSSYRLIFGDNPQATLEGWAIVDNTTADDWTGIRLSLVSGRPISFISRLYEPRYRNRPYGDLAEEAAVGPRVYEGGIASAATMTPPMPAPAPPPAGVIGGAMMRAQGNVARKSMPMEDQSGAFSPRAEPSTALVATAAREVGELFEYGFSTPVTIKRGESAMLPFLQERVNSRKLLIYSGDGVNPMNAAEITNSTGKTLDGGPITVYDSGAYGGEALVETLKAGDKRLISYAVDAGTRVTTNLESERSLVRSVRYSRGMLNTRLAEQETKVYTVKNVDSREKTLIIEHPVRTGYKLLKVKPVETTSRAYRFEVKLGAGAEVKFPVAEEYEYDDTTAIANETPDRIYELLSNTKISDAGKKALQTIAERKREIADNDAEIARVQAESTELERDQERLRQNIASLNRVSGQETQVQQYSRQLAAGEAKIVGLRDQVNELRRKKRTLEAGLNQLIENTVF